MVGPVVVLFVLAQRLQHGDGAGGEQQIGADDDQNHRHKEQHGGLDGVLGHDGDVVAAAHGDRAQQRHQRLGLGLALALLPALHQVDGRGAAQLHALEQQNQREDRPEGRRRELRRAGHELEAEHRVGLNQLQRAQSHQLAQQRAQPEAQPQRSREQHQRLHAQQPGDVALLHAENAVQAELLPPPAGEKAVGVEQKDGREDQHHHAAQRHVAAHDHLAAHAVQHVSGVERQNDVAHAHGHHAGQQIGRVELAAASEVRQRQLQIKPLIHGAHRPSQGSSACRRCAGTCRPRSTGRDRADGTPVRP